MKSISQRLLESVGANTLGKSLNIITQLLWIPVFLSYWGVELYGEWLILSTIPAYLAISDLGFGHAAANEMAIKVSQGNRTQALAIFQATALLIIIMFLAIAVLGGIILYSVPFEQWLGFVQLSRQEALLTITFLFLKIAVSQQFGLLLSGFRCEGRYPLATMLNNALIFTQFISITIALIAGANPWQIALVDFLVSISIFVLIRGFLRKQYPWIHYGLPKKLKTILKAILAPALAFLVYPFTQLIVIQGTTLLTGVLLGSTAVVLYTTVRILTNVSLRLLEILTISVWPEISIAFGKKDFIKMRQLHRLGAQITLWLSILGFTTLVFVGEFIHTHWTGNRLEWNQTFFLLMILAAFVESLQIFSKVIPVATNQHVKMTQWLLINALISLPVLWGFIQVTGFYGIAYMLLLHNVVLSVIVLWYALRLVDERVGDYFIYLVSPIVFYTNIQIVICRLRVTS
jgi:O-antigen/teichoic acid export membrane protein